MIQISDVTHLIYESEEAVFYKNMAQCAWMLSHSDCVLLDVFELNGKVVMVFPKELHKKYIKDWVKRKEQMGVEEDD